jgi:hypothetical protein
VAAAATAASDAHDRLGFGFVQRPKPFAGAGTRAPFGEGDKPLNLSAATTSCRQILLRQSFMSSAR